MIYGFLADQNWWFLKLDDENNRTEYSMQLDSLCKYIDIQDSTYGLYNLPDEPVDFSANEATDQDQLRSKMNSIDSNQTGANIIAQK